MIAPMNEQRSDACATTHENYVYVTGGFSGNECLSSAERYDPTADQWSMISSMRFRRSGVGCIGFRNFVYAIGGFNGTSRLCSAEKYNPETNVWTTLPNMYTQRSNFSVAVRRSRIGQPFKSLALNVKLGLAKTHSVSYITKFPRKFLVVTSVVMAGVLTRPREVKKGGYPAVICAITINVLVCKENRSFISGSSV